jgi:transcriptional regulator with XRE-family HTH domain
MLNLSLIGTRIATHRKNLKLTQYELADQLYVTHQAVSKWENGKSLPSIEILYDLTQLFKISIDELLDESDITDTDYASKLKNYPRQVVIDSFLRDANNKQEIDTIFYLLQKKERLYVINHIITCDCTLEVSDIWPYLNHPERTYLLGSIFAGTCDFDINRIFTQLTPEEQQIAIRKYQDGSYPYKLRQHFPL